MSYQSLKITVNHCYSQKGIDVFHEPYAHCILPDLVNDLDFINDVRDECNSQLKYIQKSNDLTSFKYF